MSSSGGAERRRDALTLTDGGRWAAVAFVLNHRRRVLAAGCPGALIANVVKAARR